jgi:hypothetical protein
MTHRNHTALEKESLAPCDDRTVLEIDDLSSVATDRDAKLTRTESRSYPAFDETMEIELDAEQMDALLEGRWEP